eukprot:TRINITY_DN66215_c0_g1_i1.p1 TRINITY_DN66215_c0_g1~~TRINITY_DN66215_c0_g1_i1.p1  ORF type:complete len:380 (+),score=61.68 TRINITY_DN66215_c0_g1_i1:69-1208(+)
MSVASFSEGVRAQLLDDNRVLRVFDIGGTGVKTALVSTVALRKLFDLSGDDASTSSSDTLEWLESPSNLGFAPGHSGFAKWLLASIPKLKDEIADSRIFFGISVKGRIVHETQTMRNWYAGGCSISGEPLIADIMGLPRDRTFALHDGSAHLLACCRSLSPPAGLAVFVLGTGVGFACTDASGRLLDRLGNSGRHMLIDGQQVATAPYEGAWRSAPSGGPQKKVLKRMVGQYGDMVSGRLGFEALDRAVDAYVAEGLARDAALAQGISTYGEQWLHFLHTIFLPEFTSSARSEQYGLQRIAFAGGVVEHNWPALRSALVESDGKIKALPPALASGASSAESAGNGVHLLQPPPSGSGLIGAALYALAGAAGAAKAIWSP